MFVDAITETEESEPDLEFSRYRENVSGNDDAPERPKTSVERGTEMGPYDTVFVG